MDPTDQSDQARKALGELTEDDLREIDAAYHQKKMSGDLRREEDRRAVEADAEWFRARGWM